MVRPSAENSFVGYVASYQSTRRRTAAIERIRLPDQGAIFEMYNHLGPGLTESIYEEAMMVEGRSRGLKIVQQVPVVVYYKGAPLKKRQRIDLLVEDKVIVELKSVELLHPQHFKQLTSQLKSTNLRLGYLVNFNCAFMKDGENLYRIVNKL